MLIRRDPPTNFVEIILDLRRPPFRMKLNAIADAINVDVNTLKGWFYDSHIPNFEDGNALKQLHAKLVESCQSNQEPPKTVIQSTSHARVNTAKEKPMAKAGKQPKQVKQPGEEPQAQIPGQEGGTSNVDAAIAAAQSGQTHKVAKPKPAVAPSKVKGDPLRPKDAAVNAKREMSHEEAVAAAESGTLTRSVLTEKGWVFPKAKEPPKGARI
jgi:hypothetical protein